MKNRFAIIALTAATGFFAALPGSAADAQRGEKLFAGNCAMCHPHGGNVLSPQKELKGEAFLKQFPQDSMIIAVVRKGIPNSVMSPFNKERLSDDQVADIVAYVRTLTPRAVKPSPVEKVLPKGSKPAPRPAKVPAKHG